MLISEWSCSCPIITSDVRFCPCRYAFIWLIVFLSVGVGTFLSNWLCSCRTFTSDVEFFRCETISDWLCSCTTFTNDVHFSRWRCDVYIWPIFTGDVHFCRFRYDIGQPGDGRLISNTKFRIPNVDLALLGPLVLLPRHLNPAPAQQPIRQRVQYGCRRSTNPMESLNSLCAHHAANQIQRCKSAFTLCVWNGQSDDVLERAAVTWATDRVIGCSESRDHGVFLSESRKGQYFNTE